MSHSASKTYLQFVFHFFKSRKCGLVKKCFCFIKVLFPYYTVPILYLLLSRKAVLELRLADVSLHAGDIYKAVTGVAVDLKLNFMRINIKCRFRRQLQDMVPARKPRSVCMDNEVHM